jgi:hypothetical protein
LARRRNAVVVRTTLRSRQVTLPSKLKGYDVVELLTPASDSIPETGENDGR